MNMNDREGLPFVSASLGEHILRGVLAIGALVLAVVLFNLGAWYAIIGGGLLVAFAFVMFRGCPVCWTVGLVGTCKLKSAGKTVKVSE
jgi:hypothetical protein